MRASVEGDRVTLTWDDPFDGSVTGYRIERREEDDPADQFVTLVEDSGSASTQYVDSSAAPESEYVYRVRAISAGVVGEPSAEVYITTPPAVEAGDPDRGVLVTLYNATDGERIFQRRWRRWLLSWRDAVTRRGMSASGS